MPQVVILGGTFEWRTREGKVFVLDAAGRACFGAPIAAGQCPHLFTVDLYFTRDRRGGPLSELIRYRDGECIWVTPGGLEDHVWDERATCLPCFEDELGLTEPQRDVFETLLADYLRDHRPQEWDWSAATEEAADLARRL